MKKWFTDNGVEIAPDLRVFTYDWCWGVVVTTAEDMQAEHFDGWFHVRWEDGERVSLYNGERLTTVPPRKFA
ncbi:hypothetical protein [Streptosporangium sp. NPDC001681]|uniref:hypothetical protein n=1 Tax=Streptosporangium sp. NPDC001681 TaxID=3154395 RepID=UPI00332170EB